MAGIVFRTFLLVNALVATFGICLTGFGEERGLQVCVTQAAARQNPGSTTGGIPSLDLADAAARPSETVRIPLTLTNASGYQVAAVSTDISYSTDILENPTAEIGPAGSEAGKSIIFKEISPGALRVAVSGLNQNLIGDGVVAYLILQVRADAALGKATLGNIPSGSDPSGNDVAMDGRDGAIFVMTILYVSRDGECGGLAPCFTSIQDAVDEAGYLSVIMVTGETYDEDVIIDSPANLTLHGGWNQAFTAQISDTVISSMKIAAGTATLERLVIR